MENQYDLIWKKHTIHLEYEIMDRQPSYIWLHSSEYARTVQQVLDMQHLRGKSGQKLFFEAGVKPLGSEFVCYRPLQCYLEAQPADSQLIFKISCPRFTKVKFANTYHRIYDIQYNIYITKDSLRHST